LWKWSCFSGEDRVYGFQFTVWQKARDLCKKIFEISLAGEFVNDFKLRNQINGSSESMMDTIPICTIKPHTRNPKHETRNSKHETRNPKYET
jgi:hypothetical protein